MASPVANGNPWAWLGGPAYFAGLMAKLPRGWAFGGPFWQALFTGFSAVFAMVQAAAGQLSEIETVPSTTTVLLPYWNYDYGLPDCCVPAGATLGQQRAALLAKIAAVGGQSQPYYVSVAAALGWAITITQGAPGSFTWTIHAAATAPASLFDVGDSGVGDYLYNIGTNAQLECVMNRIKPAHTILLFLYS